MEFKFNIKLSYLKVIVSFLEIMANFERLGIGGVPVKGASSAQRKPKFENPCSEYTNILNHDVASNSSKVLNTNKHLNIDRALNDYKPIVFKSSDDILKILESHPEIQKQPKSHIDAILAAIVSAIGAGVGFALTIYLGGVGSIAGANLTFSAVIKFAGASALANGGTAGNG